MYCSDFCLLLYASYVYAVCLSAVIRLFLANLSPYVYLQFHLSFTPFVVYRFLVYFRLLRYRLQLLDYARNSGHQNPGLRLWLNNTNIPYDPLMFLRTQTNMASVQRAGKKVNYANFNDLSSVVLYDTGKKPKGKFFPVERIIEQRRRGNVSI